MRTLLLAAAALLGLLGPPGAAPAQDVKPAQKTYQIPYKLTAPKHIVVRAKINGKGPFNFVLDTGAPALFVAVPVAKKAGIKADANGWATLDRFEFEGGLKAPRTKARIETPFQLEGMNGMGLAGMEIHGLIGYSVVAQYRMEIDFTRDKMTWTVLDYKPKLPLGMGSKGGGQGGLEVFGQVMKTLGQLLGRRSAPEVVLRGFCGMTLVDGNEYPVVRDVLDKGPAGRAGLQVGDVVTAVQGRGVTNVADVLRLARRLRPGAAVALTVKRGGQEKEIKFQMTGGI